MRRTFHLKRVDKIPENRIRRDRWELEAEESRQNGAIAEQRRDRQALRLAQPEKKISNLRKGGTRDRMALRTTSSSVDGSLDLVDRLRRMAMS